MAQAFSTFANEGVPRELVSILKVTDKNGKVIYSYDDPNLVMDIHKPLQYPNFLAIRGKRALSKETAFIISHILQDNGARSAAFGPSSELVIRGKTVSVKTGTTNNLRDNWTIGYTPNFLTAVWVGNNDNSPMNPILSSGVTGASPIWKRVMLAVLDKNIDVHTHVFLKAACAAKGDLRLVYDSDQSYLQGKRWVILLKQIKEVRKLIMRLKIDVSS
ncbi:MAG: hypothetical protein HUU56_16790 [Bdellovibrionaceae bacterium]|nr:hypothetical protein [Pseudobdellovibrionaceae bacterium]